MQRARAANGVPIGAVLADLAAVVQQVRQDPFAPHGVDRVDQLRKKAFDAAPFSSGCTGWSARRTLHTVTTDLPANFPHIFGEIDFTSHGRLLFKLLNRVEPRSLR